MQVDTGAAVQNCDSGDGVTAIVIAFAPSHILPGEPERYPTDHSLHDDLATSRCVLLVAKLNRLSLDSSTWHGHDRFALRRKVGVAAHVSRLPAVLRIASCWLVGCCSFVLDYVGIEANYPMSCD